MMTAFPGPIAVTLPLLSTIATAVLVDFHETSLFEALSGCNIGSTLAFWNDSSSMKSWSNSIHDIKTGSTVTWHDERIPLYEHVIMQFPGLFAVILPPSTL